MAPTYRECSGLFLFLCSRFLISLKLCLNILLSTLLHSTLPAAIKCKAAILTGFNQPLEIKDVEWDAPKVGEVTVNVATAGVCHSDLHYIKVGDPLVLDLGLQRAFDWS